MSYYQPMPMVPLAHMMNNNPMQIQMAPNMRKPDFPPDMNPIFVIPQIAHIKSQLKPKCRPYDPVVKAGRNPEWMIDKFEEEDERMEREERERGIVKPSRLPPSIIKKIEKKRAHYEKLQSNLKEWNPFEDPQVIGDPYKTLFIGRLSFDTTERKLRKEFDEFGPIKSVRLVQDNQTNKPRGYAFIEFEQKGNMKQAYKYAVEKRIDGREIVVDIERGRTIMKWRPKRLGGGLGDSKRRSRSEKVQKKSKEEVVVLEDEKKRDRTDRGSKKKRERSDERKKHKRSSDRKKNKHEKSKKKHK